VIARLLLSVAVTMLWPSHLTLAASKVPPGFEALLEKQTTLLDVYFANEFLMTTPAEFNTDEVEFIDPAAVAKRLPRVVDRRIVQEALTGPLGANAQLRCYTREQPNCGVLEPEVAGIIFNEDRFRVDIFVNREYLSLQTIPTRTFLPPSETGWSFLQNFATAFAGDEDDSFDSYTFNASSMLSHEETRFLITTNYSNIGDWTADDILVRRDFEGREHQLGYFRTVNDASLRFIPEFSLRGLRTASTLDTRTDLESSTGHELTIFLVNRSRVSLFKDGRLVSSRNYDAGNQVIDTTRLPNGAYPVIIRIEDASGRTREEERFYVKSSRFPPRDQLLWGVEVGEEVIRNSEDFIPEGTDNLFGRVSLSKRISDSMALNGGVAARDDDGILEFGIDRLDQYYDLQLNTAISSDEGYGFSANARTRWGDITLSGDYRETWADNDLRDELDPENPPSENDLDRFSASGVTWFAEDSRQWSTMLTWYYRGGTLQLNARNTRLTGQPNTKEYSLSYFYPLLRTGKYRLDMDFEASEFNDLTQVLLSFRFRWDEGNFNNTTGSQYQYRELDDGKSDNDLEFEASTVWRDRSPEARDLSINARMSHRSDFDDATAGMEWIGRYGELESEVRHERQDDFNRTSWVGGYYSSFAWTRSGVALGGEEQSRSAVLINLTGEDTGDVYFDVLIDGNKRGTARVGGRNLITVRPFETYEVQIIPRGDGFVSFDERRESVTLYPGNVATLTWDVSPVDVLFGRLLDQSGEPVSNAVLRGASGLAMTDENGFFQAEIKSSVTSLQAETREVECDFNLPDYDSVNGIALIGTLHCTTRPKEA